jgi:hypothetical protein
MMPYRPCRHSVADWLARLASTTVPPTLRATGCVEALEQPTNLESTGRSLAPPLWPAQSDRFAAARPLRAAHIMPYSHVTATSARVMYVHRNSS